MTTKIPPLLSVLVLLVSGSCQPSDINLNLFDTHDISLGNTPLALSKDDFIQKGIKGEEGSSKPPSMKDLA